MAPHLSVVFRWLVRLGSFPPCWRQANVTPIPTGPPSSSVANYRPNYITSVCYQPPSLFIGKVWVPVMHFCACPIHCKVHCRLGRRLGSCRFISVQPLTGLIIKPFSIDCEYWRFCVVYTDTICQTDHSTFWWMVV